MKKLNISKITVVCTYLFLIGFASNALAITSDSDISAVKDLSDDVGAWWANFARAETKIYFRIICIYY